MINYEQKYLNIIKEIILENIDKDKFNVFLFGSRARKDNHSKADVDVGILGSEKLGKSYYKIINKLEESVVPYKVEIVDFSLVESNFKKEALKKIIIWNKAKNSALN